MATPSSKLEWSSVILARKFEGLEPENQSAALRIQRTLQMEGALNLYSLAGLFGSSK